MWRLLIISALTALTWADTDRGQGLLARFGETGDPRLAATALRIFALEKKVDVIKQKLHDADKFDPAHFVSELDSLVTRAEGNGCADRQFQCGGSDRECISDLFVCDGHNDCENDHDEDDDVCSTDAVKAGNVFTGTVTWHSCLPIEDRVTRIAIIGTKRVKFFTSRVRVTAQISVDHVEGADHHVETNTFTAAGFFNFGTRRLVLFPGAGKLKNVGVVCEFNRGDNERADCTLGYKASKNTCAHALLHLQD